MQDGKTRASISSMCPSLELASRSSHLAMTVELSRSRNCEPESVKLQQTGWRMIHCERAMNRLKVGICLESLSLPLRRALAEAVRAGATGLQIDAVGELSPNKLSQTGRREFRNLLRSHDLELSALNCPLRRGLDSAEDQQPRI